MTEDALDETLYLILNDFTEYKIQPSEKTLMISNIGFIFVIKNATRLEFPGGIKMHQLCIIAKYEQRVIHERVLKQLILTEHPMSIDLLCDLECKTSIICS